MTIGSKIAFYRKRLGITQDALAQKMEVSNQAVSKWESDQCCPDISLLPLLADIFGTTIDELFDHKVSLGEVVPDVPWEDNDTLHVAVFRGRTYIGHSEACNEMTFQYEGPALNIDCALNLRCADISGNVIAGGSITCDNVYGSVQAGRSITCDVVAGNAEAGGNITCDVVNGNAEAGGNITCDEICGATTAAANIYCDEINAASASDQDRREGKSKSTHIRNAEKTCETPTPSPAP